MENLKLSYEETMLLGFKRIELDDSVFEKLNGYKCFITSLKLGNYSFGWCVETHEITLYKGINAVKRMADKYEFEFLMNLLTPEKSEF